MTAIRDNTSALMEAERLLAGNIDRAGSADCWISQAVAPLAAILLSTKDHDHQVDLTRARATAAVTVAVPGGDEQPSWVQAALRCPDLHLGEALARVLTRSVRQRDSIQSVMLEALNR